VKDKLFKNYGEAHSMSLKPIILLLFAGNRAMRTKDRIPIYGHYHSHEKLTNPFLGKDAAQDEVLGTVRDP
jgi:hypothetical protein